MLSERLDAEIEQIKIELKAEINALDVPPGIADELWTVKLRICSLFNRANRIVNQLPRDPRDGLNDGFTISGFESDIVGRIEYKTGARLGGMDEALGTSITNRYSIEVLNTYHQTITDTLWKCFAEQEFVPVREVESIINTLLKSPYCLQRDRETLSDLKSSIKGELCVSAQRKYSFESKPLNMSVEPYVLDIFIAPCETVLPSRGAKVYKFSAKKLT